MLESILQRRLQRVKDSGKPGRAVVRIRGVTDDVAAAFVRLLYAGRYRAVLLFCLSPPWNYFTHMRFLRPWVIVRRAIISNCVEY